MKILLINIDSKIPNLALKKIEKYHLDRGDEVIWHNKLLYGQVDKTYVSIIFDWNRHKTQQFLYAETGGSGYDVKKTLPKEIDRVKPRINIGFTTRGCIRNCEFCIVPQKEGKIRIENDIYDIWDGRSKDILLLDNNIFALKKYFKKICSQLRKEKLRVDFNQGLDCRLLTEDIAKELKSLSHIEYRFAFDEMKTESSVRNAIALLKKVGINRCSWYVLVGFNTTFEEDLYRLNLLRGLNQNAYVQRYNFTKDRKYIPLARWANQHHIFHAMTYREFLDKCKREIGSKYKMEFIV